jgi:hypothetical protein
MTGASAQQTPGPKAKALHEWCLRVQRDILALERCVKQNHPTCELGGSDTQAGNELKQRIAALKGLDADPGDPPEGPYI